MIERKALLLIVGNPEDCKIISETLDGEINADIKQVHTREDALRNISENYVDCLILGHSLPDCDSVTLVKYIRESKCTLPIVVSSEFDTTCELPIVMVSDDENLASEVLKAGAQGYVPLKSTKKFLSPMVNSIIGNYRLLSSIKYYKNFYDNAPVGFFSTIIEDGTFLKANAAMKKILEVETTEGLKAKDLYPGQSAMVRETLLRMVKQGPVENFEAMLTLPNGKTKWISLSCKMCKGICHLEGKCIYSCPSQRCLEGSCTDISEKKKLQAKIKELEKKELQKLKDLRHKIDKRLEELD